MKEDNYQPVFRNDKLHMSRHTCSTCVFRPGNLMHLAPGRLQSMIKEVEYNEGCIPCHSTLGPEAAVCRGQFDQHKTPLLQSAEQLSIIEWVDAPSIHDKG